VGSGLQLALACDIRVATTTARVGLPASKEGIIPGLATYRLARYVGLGRAKQLIYLGNLIGSAEAERIGLVDHLVADGRGDDGGVQGPFDTLQFETLVEQYTGSFSAGGRNAKALLADCFNQDFAEFLDFYERQQAKAVASPDFAEAQAAYREKRDANWN
jgi:enoyl-CoA hydratase/carnithine racemase